MRSSSIVQSAKTILTAGKNVWDFYQRFFCFHTEKTTVLLQEFKEEIFVCFTKSPQKTKATFKAEAFLQNYEMLKGTGVCVTLK